MAMLYPILKAPTLAVMRLFFGLRIRGREHVPSSGPVLIAANHSSFLDPPLVGAATRRPVHFLAKAELFDIPLFGGLIRRLNARPIRRGASDPGAIRTALKVLEEGHALLVFPEGTRGEEGVLREPKGGVGMLAVLGRAPVVPVYVEGSGRAWPRGARFPRPARLRVTFGAPLTFVPVEGGGRKEYYEAVSREIMAAIGRLRDGASSDGATSVVFDPRTAASRPGAVGVGGAGGSQPATKYIDGRNRLHGEG